MKISENPQCFYQFGNYEGPNCQKIFTLDENLISTASCRQYSILVISFNVTENFQKREDFIYFNTNYNFSRF